MKSVNYQANHQLNEAPKILRFQKKVFIYNKKKQQLRLSLLWLIRQMGSLPLLLLLQDWTKWSFLAVLWSVKDMIRKKHITVEFWTKRPHHLHLQQGPKANKEIWEEKQTAKVEKRPRAQHFRKGRIWHVFLRIRCKKISQSCFFLLFIFCFPTEV